VFDNNLNVVFDSQAAVQAVEYLGKLAKFSPPGISNYGYRQCIEAFVAEKGAMIWYMGRILGQVHGKAPHLMDKVDVVLQPKGPKMRAGWINWNSYMASSNTPNPAQVKEFLKFLITGDSAIRFLNLVPAHNIPALYSLADNPKLWEPEALKLRPDIGKMFFEEVPKHAVVRLWGGVVQNGKLVPGKANPYAGAVRGELVLAKVMQKHIIEGASPAEAVKWGDAQIKDVVERYKELFAR
jgi:ABC-type glycerol-3-phosphate transport system substrate-binding protein